MIVLSAGMQKAGTAWFFNLTNEMLVAAGHADIREIRTKYRLQRFMSETNCNIGTPRYRKMIPVSVPAAFGNTYVLKTHEGPTSAVALMLKSGILRAAYIYRDPRDVTVSVFEHGEMLRKAGVASLTGFDRLETYELAIEFVRKKLTIWRAWMDQPRTLISKYEQLLADPVGECRRFARQLKLRLTDQEYADIVSRYSSERASRGTVPHLIHFNKGKTGRWREVLSPEHAKLCEVQFEPYLADMGYSD